MNVRRRNWLLIVLACAVPRLIALAVWRADPETLYYALSTSLRHEGRFALEGHLTTYIEPFYPMVLAAGRLLVGDHQVALLVLQVLVASGAGVLLFELTRALTGRERTAGIAVLLYAVSPYLVRQAVSFMEVTIATVLLIAISWRMRRITAPGDAVAAGLLLAALVLTRFSFLPIAVGGVVLAWREGVIRASVVGLTLLAGIVPWMVYCQVMSGAPLPSRLGENLFVSTSAIAEPVVPEINVDVLVPVANDMVQKELNRRGVRDSDEAERDRILLHFAIDYVRAHPMTALRMKLRNLAYILQPRLLPFFDRVGTASIVDGRLFIPPQRRRPLGFEVVSAVFQSLLLVGGAAGFVLRRARWGNDGFLLLVGASLIAINAIFFPTSRLLAPMTFVLMFYAAVAIDRILPAARPGLTLNAPAA